MKDAKSQSPDAERVPMDERASKRLVQEFIHLFSPLLRQRDDHAHHPPQRVLKAYLKGQLPDEWVRPSLDGGDAPARWTLSEVSLHAVSCAECGAALERLRRSKSWFQEYFSAFAFGRVGHQGRMWALSYATSAALLLALTFNLNVQFGQPEPLLDFQHLTRAQVSKESLGQVMVVNYWKSPHGLDVPSATLAGHDYLNTAVLNQVQRPKPAELVPPGPANVGGVHAMP